MATKTVMMEHSNHILESHVDQPIGNGLDASGGGLLSKNSFEEERNTMMAGDLR